MAFARPLGTLGVRLVDITGADLTIDYVARLRTGLSDAALDAVLDVLDGIERRWVSALPTSMQGAYDHRARRAVIPDTDFRTHWPLGSGNDLNGDSSPLSRVPGAVRAYFASRKAPVWWSQRDS